MTDDLYNILLKWWDFLDNEGVSYKIDYTQKEQAELVFKFLSKEKSNE